MRFLVLALTLLTVHANEFIEDPDLDCWRSDQYMDISERTLGGAGLLDRESCERACELVEDCYAVWQYKYEDFAPYTPSMCYLSAKEMCERVENFRTTNRAVGLRWFARYKTTEKEPSLFDRAVDVGKKLIHILKGRFIFF